MTRRSVEGRQEHSLVARYTVAAGALATAAAAQYGLQLLYGGPFPLIIFPAAVLVAAWYGGFGPGLLATLGGALVATYSFLRPAAQGQIGAASDVVALLLFTLAGLLISAAVRQLRRSARSERDGRRETEKQLRQSDRLQQLTGALLQARTLGDVIATCLPELLYAIDARAGALFLIVDDGGECALAHAVGHAVNEAAEGQRWPVNADSPLGRAIRRRELVIVEGAAAPASVDAAADLTLEWRNGDAVIPLLTAGRTIGAVSLSITPSRALGGDECEFLLRAGRYAAQAIDRAQLYETAERARAEAEALRVRADSDLRERRKAEEALRWSEARYRALAARTSRLYELSAGLSKAVTLAAVAKVIVRLGKVVVGASVGSVAMLVDGGTQFEALYSEEPLPPSPEGQRRFPAADGMCGTAAVATQSPVFVGSFVEWQEKYPQSASMAADGGFVSSAALPLLADGAVLGVLSFHFTVPVNFDDEYTALLTSVAQHCAQALDRARLYETAERARAEAEAANRSKDDFLSTISHELRTPLNAILGWAAMLRSGAVDATRTQRAIEAIFNNATRQGRLIEELLDVSRIVAGRASIDPQEVDLGENIRGAVEAMMPLAAAKGVEVRCETTPGIYVVADPRRLEQVFLNLLSNAVKFTPRDGHITVDVAVTDKTAEVHVGDTGGGIDPAFLPHVFERFRQGDAAPTRTAGGLGLGLFISRQLIEAQGGTIKAESPGAGGGSTFTLTLPVVAESSTGRQVSGSASLAALAEPERAMPSLGGVRILIVDDEPDAREVMASALESCGASVVSVASAREALDALAATDVDLLLSDIAMPGQDGCELIREIRAMQSSRLATLPAAAVTAHARDDERERALAAGFHTHLTKPIHPVALARAVAALAASRSAGASSGAVVNS